MKNMWSKEDIELLKEKYLTSTNEELYKLFPNRSHIAIYKKAYKLGMRKPPEIEFKNRSLANRREKSSNWNGGKYTTSKGYIQILCPEHHRASKNGYVMEHILVFEKATGLSVPDNCVIHHLNGNKKDNRIENLCMMECGAHSSFHNKERKLSDCAKEKISKKARDRLKNPHNHPMWKNIEMDVVFSEVLQGASVKDVCKKYGISKSMYYNRKKLKDNVN